MALRAHLKRGVVTRRLEAAKTHGIKLVDGTTGTRDIQQRHIEQGLAAGLALGWALGRNRDRCLIGRQRLIDACGLLMQIAQSQPGLHVHGIELDDGSKPLQGLIDVARLIGTLGFVGHAGDCHGIDRARHRQWGKILRR